MKKYLYLIFPALAFSALPAQAVCPVCVVAVGAGLGLSEYLGIDDAIAGLWIGGLLVAVSIWTINWFNKKNWQFGNKDVRDILVALLYYGLTIWPLWSNNLIGNPLNRLWGIDKLILGITFGSLGFLLATLWYNQIKKRRGHALFPFQKVAMPVGALLILSLIFYFLTR
ncbi:MAG: hypothetical protein WC905_03040 [Patescibacteria group bacterium]|jgi:hypothetical protein